MPGKSFTPDINFMEKNKDVDGLVRALEHNDYLIRKEAARSLKKVGDERAVEPLIKSLKYENWQSEFTLLTSVREFSAEALGIIGDENAIEPLIQAMNEDDDEEVRWKSARALGQIRDDSAIDALIEALNSDSWRVRENAARSLGNIGDKKALQPLINTIDDKEWRVRKVVAVSLGKLADDKAIKPLLKTLNDDDADVQRKAIEALERMGDAAFQPLMDLFENEKDWYIRTKAVEVLGNMGDRRAVKPFLEVLSKKRKEDRNRFVRGRVIEALGKIGDVSATEALFKALDDETLFVRQKAEEALLRIRSEYANEILQFKNEDISFDYPGNWEIKTYPDQEKMIFGKNPENSIKFFINRKTNVEGVSLNKLINLWEEVFQVQNIHITSQDTSEREDMELFQITGDNLNTQDIIMVMGFKLYDLFYYIHFTIQSDVSKTALEDIDLIVSTFNILDNYN